MTSKRAGQVERVYHAARAAEGSAREALLDEMCAGDDALRQEVATLLKDEGDAKNLQTETAFDLNARTLPAAAGLERPAVIGQYRVLEVLGEGGMGIVYLAEQERPLRRQVALKVIKVGLDTRAVIARFESERQALALMDHPHIAHIYDAGASEDGRPYFAMEHVAGIPITEYCDKHRLSTQARLQLFVAVCGAIQHAHQKGVIHRDIKPSNVLVMLQDGRPVPKIIDFGVAKATQQRLTEKTVFTQHGLLIGTPDYMSPEQAEMGGLNVDTTTDIYSLGVLLYELLVGALPLDPIRLRHAGYAEIQRIIREEEPLRPSTRLSGLGNKATDVAKQRHTDLSTLRRELKGDLDWITLKAMEKDRTARYPSASEFAADVGRHLTHDAVIARPASVAYRTRKFVRKHRVGVSAGVLVIAALATGLVVSSLMYLRANSALNDSEWQAYVAALAAADAQIMAADSAARSRILAGREAERRLLAAPIRRRNWEWRYLLQKLDASVTTLWGKGDPTGNSLYASKPVLTRDERELLWATTEGVHGWDLATERLTSAWPGYGAVITLSTDGSKLLSVNWRASTPWRILATRSGEVIATLSREIPGGQIAAFSPDGERLVTTGPDGEIHLWATSSGQHLNAARIREPAKVVRFGRSDGSLILVGGSRSYFWETSTADVRELPAAGSAAIITADVSVNAHTAITGDDTGVLRLWHTDSWDVRIIGEHKGVRVVAITKDGRFIASADGDGVIRLWTDRPNVVRSQLPFSPASSRDVVVLDPHNGVPIDALLFTSDGAHLIAGSSEGVLRVWDVRMAQLSAGMTGLRVGLSPALSANGRYLVSAVGRRAPQASREGTVGVGPREPNIVELIDLQQPGETPSTAALVGREFYGITMAVSNNGTYVVADSADTVRLRSGGGVPGHEPVVLGKNEGYVTAVAIDAEGTRAAAAWGPERVFARSFSGEKRRYETARGHVRVWDLSSHREVFRAETPVVGSLSLTDLGDRLLIVPAFRLGPVNASAPPEVDCSHPIQRWHYRASRIDFEIAECADVAAVSVNGSTIVTHSIADRKVRVWDGLRGYLRATSDEEKNVQGLAASPDGSRFALRMADSVGIFDSDTAALLLTVTATTTGFRAPGRQVDFMWTSDGSRLIEASDGKVQVWDARPSHNRDARTLAGRLLALSAGTRRPSQDRPLAEEVIDNIRDDLSLDLGFRQAAMAEVQKIGDRDLSSLCRDSREAVVRSDRSQREYQRAVRMSEVVARFAPWSAYCIGVLGMAKYRTDDNAGALDTLARTGALRPEPLPIELVFKAMALHKLGRAAEAAGVAERLRAESASSSDAELKTLISELEEVRRAPVAVPKKGQ